MGRNYRPALCVWRDRCGFSPSTGLPCIARAATIAPSLFQLVPGVLPTAETTLEVVAMFVPLFAPA